MPLFVVPPAMTAQQLTLTRNYHNPKTPEPEWGLHKVPANTESPWGQERRDKGGFPKGSDPWVGPGKNSQKEEGTPNPETGARAQTQNGGANGNQRGWGGKKDTPKLPLRLAQRAWMDWRGSLNLRNACLWLMHGIGF